MTAAELAEQRASSCDTVLTHHSTYREAVAEAGVESARQGELARHMTLQFAAGMLKASERWDDAILAARTRGALDALTSLGIVT